VKKSDNSIRQEMEEKAGLLVRRSEAKSCVLNRELKGGENRAKGRGEQYHQ
jgi:hypothetical protein